MIFTGFGKILPHKENFLKESRQIPRNDQEPVQIAENPQKVSRNFQSFPEYPKNHCVFAPERV